MTARMSTKVGWPNASEVFSLHIGHTNFPLLLIAIMTFVLISSSGTMVIGCELWLPKRPKTNCHNVTSYSTFGSHICRYAGF